MGNPPIKTAVKDDDGLPENMNVISIRNAVREDWPAILSVHYRAIHETASADYSEQVLNAWHSPNVEPDFADFDKKIRCGQVVLVAEVNGMIAGFGELVPDQNELLAVYVSSDYSRQGVGAAILHELERAAMEKKLTHLQMDASLTAVPFYKAHGYRELGRAVHVLGPGIAMDCVKMKKILAY